MYLTCNRSVPGKSLQKVPHASVNPDKSREASKASHHKLTKYKRKQRYFKNGDPTS